MRPLLIAAFLLAPLASRAAESLRLDTDLLLEAQHLASANKSSSSSSGGGGGGVLSGVGVGLQVGTPTALTFKFGSGANTNIVLGVGAFFNDANGYAFLGGLSLHGDYLFTLATLVNNGSIDLTAYLGPGLWINLFNGSVRYGFFGGPNYYAGVSFIGLAGRLPLGVNLRFDAAPIEVYLELDPALFVFPGVDFFIGGSLGFRWFF